MRTLELKDIAGYLPHELKVLYEYVEIATIETIGINGGIQLGEKGDWRRYNIIKEIEKCKPILRPLSDLYKSIIHNGKEIIPIVECAKIAFPNEDWSFWNNIAACKYKGTGVVKGKFSYCEGEGYFMHTLKEGAIKNLPELFDYLHELKIDYRGLIDDGLAVPVYDLEINPYK
jgi:hypothetical protein